MDARKLTDPFPIQPFEVTDGAIKFGVPRTLVPSWLAIVAYKSFRKHHGPFLRLDEIAERGGFTMRTFLDLLNAGNGDGKAYDHNHLPKKSIMSQLEILVPGTKSYDDYTKWLAEHQDKEARQAARAVAGFGTTGDRWKKKQA